MLLNARSCMLVVALAACWGALEQVNGSCGKITMKKCGDCFDDPAPHCGCYGLGTTGGKCKYYPSGTLVRKPNYFEQLDGDCPCTGCPSISCCVCVLLTCAKDTGQTVNHHCGKYWECPSEDCEWHSDCQEQESIYIPGCEGTRPVLEACPSSPYCPE